MLWCVGLLKSRRQSGHDVRQSSNPVEGEHRDVGLGRRSPIETGQTLFIFQDSAGIFELSSSRADHSLDDEPTIRR